MVQVLRAELEARRQREAEETAVREAEALKKTRRMSGLFRSASKKTPTKEDG